MKRAWLVVVVAACGRVDFDPLVDALADGPTPSRSQLALPSDPGEALVDFPLLVVLDDTRAARDLMQPDASDLRFFDDAGNVLPHEIEQLGAPGGPPLVAWVRVPVVIGSATTIAVDYGHPPTATSTDSVWSPSYAAVWHLADLRDSTTNHHDGTWRGGPMLAATGIAGPTLQFTATDRDTIEVPDGPDLAFGTTFTASGWMNVTTFTTGSGYTVVISREQGTSSANDFWTGVIGSDACASVTTTGLVLIQGSVPASTNTWTHLAVTYDGAMVRVYRDATLAAMGAQTGPMTHAAHSVFIGADSNSGGTPDADFPTGRLDELRLEHVARSPPWLAYDVLSQRDMVITYGPVRR